MVSALAFFDPDADQVNFDSNLKKSIKSIAQIPTIIAAWDRIRNGKTPVEPDQNLTHSENFLYMLSGKKPEPLSAEAFNLYLVLLADHELNASTFALRVTDSTLSDYYSPLLYCVGIPIDLFPPMFVMSRIAGWSAHYLEQIGDNRLIRPRAEYRGALDLPFISIENR